MKVFGVRPDAACPRAVSSIAVALLMISNITNAQILKRGNGPEPDSLDPQRAQGLSAQSVLRDVFEGLTREAADGSIEPGLAARYQSSDDGLRWRFELRKNLRFSDGSPLTASDVVYSLQRALDPKTAAPYGNQLTVIRGATACLQGKRCQLAVTAKDASTVEIELATPAANFPARLSLPVAAVLHAPSIKQHGDRFTRPGNLVSSGAYQLRSWRPLGYIELEKNPHFHEADAVRIERVEFHVTEDASAEARQFEAGELHLTETVPPGRAKQLRARFGERLRVADSLGSMFLGLNLQQPPLKDNLPLRQALMLAVDRKKITDIITGMGERPLLSLIPAGLGVNPPVLSDYAAHVSQARALYAQAGYSQERPLELELRYNSSLLNRKLMLAVSVMWEQALGVRTVLRQEEWKVFVQNRKTKRITQAFRYGWNADLADAIDFLELFASDSPLNVTGFSNADYDRQLLELRATPAGEKATALTLALEQKILQHAAIVPLFQYTSKHLVSDKLGGFHSNPLDHHPTRLMYWKD
jgi:oligopeptide transport system substrate-binding protein